MSVPGNRARVGPKTLIPTGRALLLTTLLLSAGFCSVAATYTENMRTFEPLAVSAILLAPVPNSLLVSALMVLAARS